MRLSSVGFKAFVIAALVAGFGLMNAMERAGAEDAAASSGYRWHCVFLDCPYETALPGPDQEFAGESLPTAYPPTPPAAYSWNCVDAECAFEATRHLSIEVFMVDEPAAPPPIPAPAYSWNCNGTECAYYVGSRSLPAKTGTDLAGKSGQTATGG